MRIVIAFTAALLSACGSLDIASQNAAPVQVGEYKVNVGAMPQAGYYAATDAEIKLLASHEAPPHIRLQAIEKATGCSIDPLTVDHPSVSHSTARVIC